MFHAQTAALATFVPRIWLGIMYLAHAPVLKVGS